MEIFNFVTKWLFWIFQYGGAIVAGISVITFFLARRSNNTDQEQNSIWGMLGGIACYAFGAWLNGGALPKMPEF